jgi:tetratricopeptide (TPR) repeat protein
MIKILNFEFWMLNYMNFPFSFKIQNLRFKILLLALGFFCASCHTNTKSNKQVAANDSASRQHTDTITPKINSYTGRILANPNDADAYYNRGKLELLTKNLGPALGDLTKAVMLDSTKSDYYYSLADINFITGHTHEARDAFATSIRLNPQNTDAILKLAELYFYVKKYEDAIGLINQAIKVNPYIAREYFLKGLIYIEKPDTEKAMSSMQTAIEQDPNYFDAYIQLGLLFAAKGNPVALTYYDDAAHVQPQNPEPYYDRGMYYQNGGDYDNAVKAYNELLEVDSTYKNALYNLGVIYNVNKADYITSLKYFNKAIKCDSTYYMAYYGRGNCYEMLNQANEALADYAHAARINPGFKDAVFAYRKLKAKIQ